MITVLEATEQITTIPEGLANTALGMGTVFAVLILISFIIYLLKFVPALLERKGKEKAAEETVQVQKPVQQETVPVQEADNNELIAVIAAAGSSTDVRGDRHCSSTGWSGYPFNQKKSIFIII